MTKHLVFEDFIEEVSCVTEEDVQEHVRNITEDITAGRVAPKQIDEIESAIHKHQTAQSLHRAIRPK